jgi:CHAT domain-containing protein
VSREDVQVHRLAGRGEIEERVRETVKHLRRHRPGGSGVQSEITLAALSRLILAPARDRLAAFPRLVVLADGALHAVPFTALPAPENAGTALLDHHEIVYLPSATVLAWQRQRLANRPLAPRPLAMLADAVFQASDPRLSGQSQRTAFPPDLSRALEDLDLHGLRRLPFSGEEARSVIALVPDGRPLAALGFAANRERVLAGELADYRVVHFATHGLLHPLLPQLSGLVLSLYDAEGHPVDGFLRAHEIAALELPAELVVLSACETGLGREIRGEGMVGLSHAFFRAGARRLVLSLWNVDDRATAELMTRFYVHLWSDRLPAGQALRRAQLDVRAEEKWQEPYYWAAFTLQGDWK